MPAICAKIQFTVPKVANPMLKDYLTRREVGAGRRLANPVRSGRKQP